MNIKKKSFISKKLLIDLKNYKIVSKILMD